LRSFDLRIIRRAGRIADAQSGRVRQLPKPVKSNIEAKAMPKYEQYNSES
jgi:hypothetical protein